MPSPLMVRRTPGRRRRGRPSAWIGHRKRLFYLVWDDKKLALWFVPFRGYIPVSLSTTDGRVVWSSGMVLDGGVVVKRVAVGASSGESLGSHLAPVESTVFSKLHPLVKHCAVTKYDDGEARTPGTVQIRTHGSSWTVQVVDIDGEAFFVAIGPTLDDALALASMLLESESAPWEVARWLKGKKTKK